MSSKDKKGGQKGSKAKAPKVVVADLVSAEDPFLSNLGRRLRKNQKAIEKVEALEIEIKNSNKQPDANQKGMLARKPDIVEEMKKDKELVDLYVESHPDWKVNKAEKEEQNNKNLAAAVEAKLLAAFGTFAGILSLAQVREHVTANEDERAWLETTLASYDALMADAQNPETRSAFAKDMSAACVSDMSSFVDKASSKNQLAASHAAVRAKTQAKEAVSEPAPEEKEENATEEVKANNEEPAAQETTANAAEETAEGDKQASEAVANAEGQPEEERKTKPRGEGRENFKGQRGGRDGDRGGRGGGRGRGGRGRGGNYNRGPPTDQDGFQTAGEKPKTQHRHRDYQGRGGRRNFDDKDNNGGIRDGQRRGGRPQTAQPREEGDNNKANEGKAQE